MIPPYENQIKYGLVSVTHSVCSISSALTVDKTLLVMKALVLLVCVPHFCVPCFSRLAAQVRSIVGLCLFTCIKMHQSQMHFLR